MKEIEIPQGTEWLLEFANLGREKGVLSPPPAKLDALRRKPQYKPRDALPTKFPQFVTFDKKGGQYFQGDPIVKAVDFPLAAFKKFISKKGIPPFKRGVNVRIGENYDEDDQPDDSWRSSPEAPALVFPLPLPSEFIGYLFP